MRLRTLLCLACALLVALPALAQIPTATLRGQVENEAKGLPGVSVTVTSPNLQGTRSTVTTANGDYILPLLPPGDYTVKFELQGFQALERTVTLAASQTTPLDVNMSVEKVSEEIVVTGTAETISVTPQAQTTYEKKLVEELPIARDIVNTVLLAPGVSSTGPSAGVTISGSQSYENLFLVNGVVVNENLRGQPYNLFIEDAIQETTVSTSSVSAEYGRFGGGVVSTITKSGGNEVHASGRDSLTNDKWSAPTDRTVARTDKNNNRYEATLGGYLWKDRLWYFGAGRAFKQSLTGTTVVPTPGVAGLAYPQVNDEKRYEGKLTLSPAEGHRIIGSYIKIDQTQDGNVFGNVLDLKSLVNRSLPQKLQAYNYTGIFTDKFFAEAQYSQREQSFIHAGSTFTDLVNGTLFVDRPTGFRWNAPTFCGVCQPEERNNSNDTIGAHDMVFGYDNYDDIRKADNHQSGSDYRIILSNYIYKNGQLFPVLLGGPGATSGYIQWNPIFISSQGTSFKTNSLFYNDKWRLNDHFSFNVGVRYDKNAGDNSQGQAVAKDSRVSPRLAAAWDLKGNGDWVINAGAAQYVTAIANSQADSTSAAGNPATYQFWYRGPSINAPGTTNLTTPADAINQIFNWFNSVGGTNNSANLRAVAIPGGQSVIRGSLDSPYTEELSIGFTKRLGTRGIFRADIVRRNSKDFYSTRTDLTTGPVTLATGQVVDLAVLENTSKLQRTYTGLHTQFQYRVTDNLSLGGTYTLSELKGNVDGETINNGPISASDFLYPQYIQARWNDPKGDLSADQRHRVRAWAVWDLFKNSHNALNVSILQNYYSGTAYAAIGSVNSSLYVTNPGYKLPPTSVAYYYSKRDAFHTPNISDTDLALNYSFLWNGPFEKSYEIFFEPEVLNVLGYKGYTAVNTAVFDNTTDPTLAKFNPFTQTPAQGVNYRLGPSFGRPRTPLDYQTPRTYRFSVGVRF
jgi:Carboxypeptidase regulatory-like domain/TonB-dependent Receptor Plug Domain